VINHVGAASYFYMRWQAKLCLAIPLPTERRAVECQFTVLRSDAHARYVRWPLLRYHFGLCACWGRSLCSLSSRSKRYTATGTLFVWFLLGVIVIAGGLIYFPALALGSIVEPLRLAIGTLN
jgi:hypothetical protein